MKKGLDVGVKNRRLEPCAAIRPEKGQRARLTSADNMASSGIMKKTLAIFAGITLGLTLSASGQEKKSDANNFFEALLKPKNFQKVDGMKVLKLKNGTRAVIEENHSAPVVAVQIWIKAGSADETDDLAGAAHLIEHMIFKGSEKFGVGEMARQVESRGGEINAYTTNDYTVYHITISSRFLELAMDLLSDSVLHPKFDPEELYNEREVVLEEIRRQGDNPGIRVYHQLIALAYQVYPYRRPVIGFQKTVGQFEQEHLLRFFNCYYDPNNIIVVLAGDLDEKSAVSFLNKYFGKEKEKAAECPKPSARSVLEPEATELKISLSPDKLERAYVNLAWKIPRFGDPDMAGLDLLAIILGQGESSRLTESIRDQKKLVDQIWAYSDTPVGPGVLLIGMTLDSGKLLLAGEEIIHQINRIKEYGVFDWELERAKRQLESDSIFTRETMAGRARRIGYFAYLAQNPAYEKIYLDQMIKVDSKEIQRLARKYLSPSRLTLAGLIPEKEFKPELEPQLLKAIQSQDAKKPEPAVAEKPPGISSARLWPIPGTGAKTSPVSEPKRYVLKNGVRLLVRENHYVPLVSVRAGFPGGVRFEDPANNGIFNFIAEMLTEGTKNLGAIEIHRRIESLAGAISGFAGKNSFGASMTIPSPNFDQGFSLFSDLILNPGFPQGDVNRIKMLILAGLKREQDQPRIMVRNLFLETLYAQHPYRLNPLGTEETVKKISRASLLETYQRFAHPENLVIAISGDVDAEKVKARVEELFGNWQSAPAQISLPGPEPEFGEPRIKETERKAVQTQIMLGWLGTTVSAADQPGLEVLSEVLGGMSGRLFIELREKRSLAYEVSAYHLEGIETGYLAGYIGCAPEKKEEAVSGMRQEFEKLKQERISEDELVRAKNSLIGTYEIDLQSNLSVAGHLFFDELMGLGFGHWQKYQERIEQVSAEQIQELANKYISPGYALVVLNPNSAGDQEKNQPQSESSRKNQ